MTDLDDKTLDHLLSTLDTPEPPAGLNQRIMNALPPRKQGWKATLSDLLGTGGLALPASGALACLLVGATLGYGPVSNLTAETVEDDWLITDVFGDEALEATIEELTQ